MSVDNMINLKEELKFGRVFCPAAFIECNIDVAVPNRICCRDKKSNLTNDEIRDRMLSGQKSPGCEFCYQQEENKSISLRQGKIKDTIQKYSKELERSVTQWLAHRTLPPQMVYQITSSNVCNYACIMCIPERSSALSKKMGLISQIKQVDISKLQIPGGAQVALAGGEPFLIKDYLDLLERMPGDVELTISTNGSIINDKLISLLKKFKKFYLMISIDSVSDQYDKIRINGNWATVEQNVNIFRSNFSNITVLTTIQKDNINDLYSTHNWTKEKNIEWKAHILTFPTHLHWKNNPNIDVDQLSRINCPDIKTKSLLQSIVQECKNNVIKNS